MRERQIHIPANDTIIFARLWHARNRERGIVLIVHDVSEHSQRYESFALFFAHHDYTVVSYDLRGHGFSALDNYQDSIQTNSRRHLLENPNFKYMPAQGGCSMYVDDFSAVLKYIFSQYSADRCFIFGHGIGSMIITSAISHLPLEITHRLTGIILSAPPTMVSFYGRIKQLKLNAQIRKYGDAKLSKRIDELLFNFMSQSKNHLLLRTEFDWISSQAEEVDIYMADPLCGNVIRLGLYKTIMEVIKYAYKRKNSIIKHHFLPIFIFSGTEDPFSGYGRAVTNLGDLFRNYGWPQVDTWHYLGRHDLLHDRVRADVYNDCLEWMEG